MPKNNRISPDKNTKQEKKPIIILHDTFLFKGGGERLVYMMAEALKCDIAAGFFYSGSFDLKAHGFSGKQISIIPPVKIKGLRHILLKIGFQTKTKFLQDYSRVVFSGDCLAAIKNAKQAKKIYYCHTVPRYLFDRREFYLQKVPFLLRPLYILVLWYFKKSYLKDLAHVDEIYVNSKNILQRLKKFTGREAKIIYPPVDLDLFTPVSLEKRKNYYLSFARLASAKRVDRIARAFGDMRDKQLIILHGKNDPQQEEIKKIGKNFPNIHFHVEEDNTRFVQYIQEARATLYIPEDEDFGMSPLESIACGVPVIGVNEGGLKETLIHKKTGLLLSPQVSHEEIKASVRKLDHEYALSLKDSCIARAHDFSRKNFEKQIKELFL